MTCPSCESLEIENLGRIAPAHRPGHDEFEIHECNRCGLSFSHPTPDAERVREFYAAAHPYAHVYGDCDAPWQRHQHQLDLLRLGPPRGQRRLLDVGCSFGLMLEVASDLGWDAYGIEPDDRAVERARARVGRDKVRVGFADDLPTDWGVFEAISMSHVLEHCTDFHDVLRGCASLLAPGGVVAVQVPNRYAIANRRRGAIDYRPLEHPFYWSWRPLANELRRVGLRPAVAPSRFFAKAPSWNQRAKAGALAMERLSLPAFNWGIKSTLEVHGHKQWNWTGD